MDGVMFGGIAGTCKSTIGKVRAILASVCFEAVRMAVLGRFRPDIEKEYMQTALEPA